ncbi:MAG: hypothetical protein NC231_02200 [Bacillus sp. (in: Bacteria)]|nr:hypothetical protein [Bacillus sp. (in: firmicutes)]MCM1426160.1 hypothetical protein [Eubacterium sp.]
MIQILYRNLPVLEISYFNCKMGGWSAWRYRSGLFYEENEDEKAENAL